MRRVHSIPRGLSLERIADFGQQDLLGLLCKLAPAAGHRQPFPYVTSAFSEHSLVATTTVLSSIIGAVAKLPIAKIIDIWGRAEGYSLMVFLCTIGEPCRRHGSRLNQRRGQVADCLV